MTRPLFDVAACEKIMTDSGLPPMHARAIAAAISLAITQAFSTLVATGAHARLGGHLDQALAKQTDDLTLAVRKGLNKLTWRILSAFLLISIIFAVAVALYVDR